MNVIAIGAHPDDLEPQIGGTIAKLKSQNADIKMVSVFATATGSSVDGRKQEAINAAKILDTSYIFLDTNPENVNYRSLVRDIDKLFISEKPDLIFCVNNEDTHQDHRVVGDAVESSCRKNQTSLIFLNQVVPGGVNTPNLNYFTDISDFQKKKMLSCMSYTSQINKYGDSWMKAIESRDSYWGFNLGKRYAEAAYAVKIIS